MEPGDVPELQQEYLEEYKVELSEETLENRRDEAIDELNEKLDFQEGLFENPTYEDFGGVEDAFHTIRLKMWGDPGDYDDDLDKPNLYKRQKEAEYLADVAFALEEELNEEQDAELVAQ